MNKTSHETDGRPQAVRQLLDESLGQIGQPVLSRLHDARKQAMSHYGAKRTAPAHAWAGFGHGGDTQHRFHYRAAAVLLAVALFGGIAYWQHVVSNSDACNTCDTDIAILTGDLPVYVYTD
jgi:Protein of unknown function (DUF3619)